MILWRLNVGRRVWRGKNKARVKDRKRGRETERRKEGLECYRLIGLFLRKLDLKKTGHKLDKNWTWKSYYWVSVVWFVCERGYERVCERGCQRGCERGFIVVRFMIKERNYVLFESPVILEAWACLSCSFNSFIAWISFFNFIRRFWNQILICLSDKHSAWAISILLLRVR